MYGSPVRALRNTSVILLPVGLAVGKRKYLDYLVVDFERFRPADATRCTYGVKFVADVWNQQILRNLAV